ncbi:hypothetical protein Q7P37_001667 [Cladosporium fusiforme]
MVYLSTMEEWQQQATLLFQARPATARITTKYHIPNLESAKYASKKRKRTAATEENKEEEKAGEDAPRVPRGTLEVKAYDPESGVTLKFKTEKSADVGRLIAGLGRVGRYMAALPEKAEAPQDATMEDAPAAEGAEAKDEPTAQETKPAPPATGGAGGGKKKKKGKK